MVRARGGVGDGLHSVGKGFIGDAVLGLELRVLFDLFATAPRYILYT